MFFFDVISPSPPASLTSVLLVGHGRAASLVVEVEDFASATAGFGASSEVDKWEALVLCQCSEVEVLGAEEEQRVEEHYRGVGSQLLTLPQVGLLNTRGHHLTCERREEAACQCLLQLVDHLSNMVRVMRVKENNDVAGCEILEILNSKYSNTNSLCVMWYDCVSDHTTR